MKKFIKKPATENEYLFNTREGEHGEIWLNYYRFNLAIVDGEVYGRFYRSCEEDEPNGIPRFLAVPESLDELQNRFNPYNLLPFKSFVQNSLMRMKRKDEEVVYESIFKHLRGFYSITPERQAKWLKAFGAEFSAQYKAWEQTIRRKEIRVKRAYKILEIEGCLRAEKKIPVASPAQIRIAKRNHAALCGEGIKTFTFRANMGSCQCGDVYCKVEVDYKNRTIKRLDLGRESWMKGSLQGSLFKVPYAGGMDLPYSNFRVI